MVAPSTPAGAREFVVFRVGAVACGLSISDVQEIKRIQVHTVAHRAPAYVRGLVNMRGQIVTLIDLRERLGLPLRQVKVGDTAVIVADGDELIGLLVDEVDDVIQAEADAIQPPPPNLRGIEARFMSAVIRTPERLIALMDKTRLARVDEDPTAGSSRGI